jgi:hypothetical protein
VRLGRVCDAPQPGGWQVASVRCDDLVRVGSADRLVFKIDVEGNEPRVLAGLSASMRTAAAAAGIVEFFHLDRAQKHELGAEHAVYAAGLDGTLLHRLDGSAIDAIFPAPGVVTPGYAKDVVLVTAGAQRLLDSTAGLRDRPRTAARVVADAHRARAGRGRRGIRGRLQRVRVGPRRRTGGVGP